MASKHIGLVSMVLLACCALAAAQPCIECKDCKGSNHCLSNCKRTCQKPQVVVNGEDCKKYGKDVHWKAAKLACDNTMLYCSGGQQQKTLGARRYFPVSLGQCANIAYGLCQSQSMDRWKSPCGWSFNGHKQCNKQAFMEFYTGEVNERCNQAVKWIDEAAAKNSKP